MDVFNFTELNEVTTQSMRDYRTNNELLDRYQAEFDYNGAFPLDVDKADVMRSVRGRQVG